TLELLVRGARLVADGIVALVLEHPERRELPPWRPGAHIDLVLPSGLVRQYSLCGDPDDRLRYRIAVLREQQSRGGSREVHDTGLVGKRLRVGAVRNHFRLVDADQYLFIAGGIGITPILPMLRDVDRSGAQWTLVYGGRTRGHLAFLDEIGDLAHGSTTILTEDREGRPDLAALFSTADPTTTVYCCGPNGMLEAAETAAAKFFVPGSLHIERFTGPDSAATEANANTTFEVELARTGVTLTVPPDRSILDVVLDVAPHQLYSCEEGYCGTCETRVLDGEPDHRDSVLTAEERRGRMMICVGRSRCPKLVLDI
ncbi:MAG: PDR/VanB family oxidoreductase, partial [Sciscionella sp.]